MSAKTLLCSLLVLPALCYSAATSAGTRYVDAAVPMSGDGTSWEMAFKTIQEGIDFAFDGDTVMVAQGTYVENVSFNGKNIVLTSTDPLDPAVVADTIIDGNQADSVVTFAGTETETCVLSGFTIRNGKGEYGAGIYGETSTHVTHATIENNRITGNTATSSGGGLAGCDGTIQNNVIAGNSAGQFGGGLHHCRGTIQNNTIIGNLAGECGGGLSGCDGTIQNNVIAGNSATRRYGGGLFLCNAAIRNNTITANSAGKGGGGLSDSGAAIHSCIIWGNMAPTASQVSGSITPTYSCIQDWTTGGEGNISQNPQFVDQDGADNDPQTFADNDYRLLRDSPCIDAGRNEDWMSDAVDLDGNPRIINGTVDMGAYERVCQGGLTWYVSGSVAASGDGSTWETAFKTVHEGLRSACSGDTVTVAEGLYVENIYFRGKNIVLTSIDPFDPDVVANTIIEGNQAGSVVTFDGTENETCVLSGFTIRNGSGTTLAHRYPPPDTLSLGAGIIGGNPWGEYTRAAILNNIITDNAALGQCGIGGGIACCDGIIANNTIARNIARGADYRSGYGGGLCECGGSITNNLIQENQSFHGAGLNACDGTIQKNVIIGNSAGGLGGGVRSCNGIVRYNLVAANSAVESGGGLCGCRGTIESNMITGNSADQGGGLWGLDATIRNNTIAGNLGRSYAGGLCGCDGTITNCIIWGNTTQLGPQVEDSSTPTYSCLQGWSGDPETRNISGEPLFVDPDGPDDDPATYEDNDYRLQRNSPCIDVGKNGDWMSQAVDLDGNPRVWRGKSSRTVDMGAYEYGSFHFEITGIAMGPGAQIRWNSRPSDNYAVHSCGDLSGDAWRFEATVPSQGETTSWSDLHATSAWKFYRIELQ